MREKETLSSVIEIFIPPFDSFDFFFRNYLDFLYKKGRYVKTLPI